MRRSVLQSFYVALETSVFTFTTTQISAQVTPSFNLTLLAVMARVSSFVRDFTYVSKLLLFPKAYKAPNRVRRMGSDLELCHHCPPGYKSAQTVSVG